MVLRIPIEDRNSKILDIDKKLLFYYFSISIIYVILDYITKVLLYQEETISYVLNDIVQLILLNGISVTWFLSALILGKIYTRCIVKSISSKSLRMIIAIISYYIILFMHNKFYTMLDERRGINTNPLHMIMFALGHGIMLGGLVLMGYELKDKIMKLFSYLKTKKFYSLLLCIPVIFNFLYVPKIDYSFYLFEGNLFADSLLMITGIIFVFALSSIFCQNKYLKKPMAIIGQNSFIIMVTHFYVIDIVCNHFLNSIGLSHGVFLKLLKLFVLGGIEALFVFLNIQRKQVYDQS